MNHSLWLHGDHAVKSRFDCRTFQATPLVRHDRLDATLRLKDFELEVSNQTLQRFMSNDVSSKISSKFDETKPFKVTCFWRQASHEWLTSGRWVRTTLSQILLGSDFEVASGHWPQASARSSTRLCLAEFLCTIYWVPCTLRLALWDEHAYLTEVKHRP